MFARLKHKFHKTGVRGLVASGLRYMANRIEPIEAYNHQLLAHHILSRYTEFKGKSILEIGGAQECASAYPFLIDGAERVVVTGLDHIDDSQGGQNVSTQGLSVLKADALQLSNIFDPSSFASLKLR